MEPPERNIDTDTRLESLGARLAHYTMLELLFWVVIGLLCLAFEGGIVGLVIVAIVGVVVGFAWRDVTRRAQNPIQQVNRSAD